MDNLTPKQSIEFFYYWLEYKGIKEQYIQNRFNHPLRGRVYNLARLAVDKRYNEFLLDAFVWIETPEGLEYWMKLNYEWLSLLASDKIVDLLSEKSNIPINIF